MVPASEPKRPSTSQSQKPMVSPKGRPPPRIAPPRLSIPATTDGDGGTAHTPKSTATDDTIPNFGLLYEFPENLLLTYFSPTFIFFGVLGLLEALLPHNPCTCLQGEGSNCDTCAAIAAGSEWLPSLLFRTEWAGSTTMALKVTFELKTGWSRFLFNAPSHTQRPCDLKIKSVPIGQIIKDPQLDVQEINGVQEIPSQKRSRHPKCLFYSGLVP